MRSAVLGQSLQTGVEPKASPDRVHERVGCAAVERDIRVAVLPQINLEAQHRGRAAGLSGLGHVCCCRIKLLRPDEISARRIRYRPSRSPAMAYSGLPPGAPRTAV